MHIKNVAHDGTVIEWSEEASVLLPSGEHRHAFAENSYLARVRLMGDHSRVCVVVLPRNAKALGRNHFVDRVLDAARAHGRDGGVIEL